MQTIDVEKTSAINKKWVAQLHPASPETHGLHLKIRDLIINAARVTSAGAPHHPQLTKIWENMHNS